MKKSILGLGSAAAIIAPIAGVIACGDEEKAKEKTVKEILTYKVLVLASEDAVKTDTALIAAIKAKIIKDYGLQLKKAHMLTVNSDKSDGTTLVAITATKDDEAKIVYVKVEVDGKEIAKEIEVKVRKETNAEKNKRIVDILKEKLETNFTWTSTSDDKSLDLKLDVSNGISDASAYTTAKALTSLKDKIKAASWANAVIDGWIDDANVLITINKFDTTAAEKTANNTVDLSTAKKIEVTITAKFGSEDIKVEKTSTFYVKAT